MKKRETIRLVFLGRMIPLLLAVHAYVWVRWMRDLLLPSPCFGLFAVLFVGMAVNASLGMIVAYCALPRSILSPLLWTCYLWLGFLFFLFVIGFSLDVVWLLTQAFVFCLGLPSLPIARGWRVAWVTTALALSVVSLFGAMRSPCAKRVRLLLPSLSPYLSGYTIVQLSDLHVGPLLGRSFVEKVVKRVNQLQPDLIAITGDLVDGPVRKLGSLVAPLADLRARDGVFFVTGNHEYYSEVEGWVAFLEQLGIRVLRSERVSVAGEHGIDVAGVDDGGRRGSAADRERDLEQVTRGRNPTRPLLLLAHRPEVVIHASQKGVDVQLSGHTHGGQLFPFHALVKLDQPYLHGLHHHGTTQVYVSRGTGWWGPPMRLVAPAEISCIELIAKERGQG